MKKSIILILIIAVSFLFAQENKRKAPDFRLENIKGKTVTLKNYLGDGPVLLCFWATWCKPCVDELKAYQKIYKELSSKGMKMVAVSNDNERSMAKVKPFVKRKKLTFEVLLDPNRKVAKKYYANNVPHTVIIDKTGNIVYSHAGYKHGDEKKVKQIITDLLKEN
ncbi:MAG: peroxiredoxin family protein [Rhodothermaceae bacterium]